MTANAWHEPIQPGLPTRKGKRWYCVRTGDACIHVMAPGPLHARLFAGWASSIVQLRSDAH